MNWRYFDEEQPITSVFLSLDWNSGVEKIDLLTFEGSSCISKLVQWGRPLWSSFYHRQRKPAVSILPTHQKDASDLRRCEDFAFRKVIAGASPVTPKADLDDSQAATVFAILASRLPLDLDFVFPSLRVASKFRWLVDVDDRREHLVSTYCSEPLLAEATAYAMNSYQVFTTRTVSPVMGFVM
jgi:hypothetical protein